jgi:hypothetical protein
MHNSDWFYLGTFVFTNFLIGLDAAVRVSRLGKRMKVATPLQKLRDRAEIKELRGNQRAVAIIFGALAAGGIAYPRGQLILDGVVGIVGIRATQLAVGVAVIVIGVSAHVLKSKDQLRYGLIEVFFGGAGGMLAAAQVTKQSGLFPALFGLGGSVYVVARGCANITEGWEKYKAATERLRQELILASVASEDR